MSKPRPLRGKVLLKARVGVGATTLVCLGLFPGCNLASPTSPPDCGDPVVAVEHPGFCLQPDQSVAADLRPVEDLSEHD
jgi:hypothetical protein